MAVRISLKLNPGYAFEQYMLLKMTEAKTSSGALIRAIMTAALVFLLTAALARAELLTIKIGYVGRAEKKATISLLDYPPDNDGVAGARLALDDNNTTGKFLNQHFLLEEVRVKDGTDPADVVLQLPIAAFRFSSWTFRPICCSRPPRLDAGALSSSSMRGRSTTGCARKIAAPT